MNVELLKLFVSEIDAQLLQAIHVQNFKAVNVEQPNSRICLLFFGNDRVDVSNDPFEQTGVEQLAERIPLVLAVIHTATTHHRACPFHSCCAGEM